MASTGQASSFSPDHANPSRMPQDRWGWGSKARLWTEPPGAHQRVSGPQVQGGVETSMRGIDPLVMEMRKPIFICDTLAQLVNTRNGERCSKNTI